MSTRASAQTCPRTDLLPFLENLSWTQTAGWVAALLIKFSAVRGLVSMHKEVTMDSNTPSKNNSSTKLGLAHKPFIGVVVSFCATLLVAVCLAAEGVAGGNGMPARLA